MNPFMLSASERIDFWSSFRDSLPEMEEQIQLSKVASFWSLCPFSNWTMDPEVSKKWPTVWEMLHEGEYCRNAIALGIESTLRWSGWDAARIKLTMIKNIADGDEFFVVIIDDAFVLNYSYSDVEEVGAIQHEFTTLYSYSWAKHAYNRI